MRFQDAARDARGDPNASSRGGPESAVSRSNRWCGTGCCDGKTTDNQSLTESLGHVLDPSIPSKMEASSTH